MAIVGFHAAEIVPTSADPENANLALERASARAAGARPGVNAPGRGPAKAAGGPDQYLIGERAIGRLGPPAPVLKTVADTVAVKKGAPASGPPADAVTVPSWAERVVVPLATEPRFFDEGTLIVAAPAGDEATTTPK